MYIGYFAFDIANPTKICYDKHMNGSFENRLTYNQILFRYAKGKSLVEGYEIHPYNEILFYMGGGGRLLTEHFEENLRSGTLIIIPKNTYHQMLISDQENYKRFVLNFPDLDMPQFAPSGIKMLHPVSYNITFLLERMCEAMKNGDGSESTCVLLYGAFLMLIAEMERAPSERLVPRLRKNDDLISRSIRYIDENFTAELSVEQIAREMNVSPSSLFQSFKKQLGISVYKYITEKRLIYAHNLIDEKTLPTKAYLECGYKDYATFYKAYVKMFGHPPSRGM